MLDIKIKKMIECDIELLSDAVNNRKGSQALYEQLTSKYNIIVKDFDKDIKTNGKARSINDEFDYRPELKQVLEKLKMYILLDEIPDQYKENKIDNSIIIKAKKIKNSVIGQNASQTINKQTDISPNINVNTDKKENWFTKIIKKFTRKKD